MTRDESERPDLRYAAETALVAAASAIPVVGGPISVVLDRTLQRTRQNIVEVAQAAVDEVGVADALVDRLESDERLAYLLLNAAEAGERTSMAAKRRLLGRAVGRAARDGARIDESEFQVRALRDLDVPHVQAMSDIEEQTRRRDGTNPVIVVREALERYPAPIRAALIQHGLVEQASTWDDMNAISGLNDFGAQLLEDLRSEGAADQDDRVRRVSDPG